jgi:hypothetical protein
MASDNRDDHRRPLQRPIAGRGRDERAPARSGREFHYQPRTLEMVRRQMERARTRFDSPFRGDLVRWKAGDNVARILPSSWKNADHYSLLVWEHRYVGAEESHYLCLRRMRNEPCPICDAEREAHERGNVEEAKKYKPMQRWACYVLNRQDQDDPMKPRIWDMNGYQDEEILAVTRDKQTDAVLYIEHLDEGFDLTFRRTGTGRLTRYGAWAFDRQPSPVSDDPREIEEIKDFLEQHPLDEQLRYYDADYLQQILFGTAEARDEDLDDDGAVAAEAGEEPWKGDDRFADDRFSDAQQPGEEDGREPDLRQTAKPITRRDPTSMRTAAAPRQKLVRPQGPRSYR